MSEILLKILYILSQLKYNFWLKNHSPEFEVLASGQAITTFTDPNDGIAAESHNVIVFLVKGNVNLEGCLLMGPLGLETQITFFGVRLYGRDSWGHVSSKQLADDRNKNLRVIVAKKSKLGDVIQLAGIRDGTRFWDDPKDFMLIRLS